MESSEEKRSHPSCVGSGEGEGAMQQSRAVMAEAALQQTRREHPHLPHTFQRTWRGAMRANENSTALSQTFSLR